MRVHDLTVELVLSLLLAMLVRSSLLMLQIGRIPQFICDVAAREGVLLCEVAEHGHFSL